MRRRDIDLYSTFQGEQTVDPVLLNENFNGSASNWTTKNNSYGGTSSASNWTLRPDGYSPRNYGNTISSDDRTQFYLSDSDAQGPTGTTETILQYKNSINTIGYTELEFSFWHDYLYYNDDRG